jgi:hypothetical protein
MSNLLRNPDGLVAHEIQLDTKEIARASELSMIGRMPREQIKSVVASGIPFTLRMADGKEYFVPYPDYISIPPKGTYVIVFDDEG